MARRTPAHSIFVGRRLSCDLVSGSQDLQPYRPFSVLLFGPTSTLEARQPSDRSLLEPDKAYAAGIVGELYPIM
jgi:hypothetical protein